MAPQELPTTPPESAPALPPVVAASERFHSVTAAPRRVKAGPLAAAVATAAILAASAVPSLRSVASAPFPGGPSLPAPVIAELIPTELESVPGLGPLTLDGVFRGAVPATSASSMDASGEPFPAWIDREDGTSTLRVELVLPTDPSTRLEGRLHFRGRVSTLDLDHDRRGLFVPTLGTDATDALNQPSSTPALVRLDLAANRSATSYDARADAYGLMSGELTGTGKWRGITLAVRPVPGSSVRRGPWADRDEIVEDTVFASLIWFSTQSGRPAGSAAVDVPDHGYGAIALSLRP